MLTVFSIAICLGLLALMVYGLHRHQNIEVEFSVDRNKPLPPLNIDTARASAPMQRVKASSTAPSPTPPTHGPASAEITAAELAAPPKPTKPTTPGKKQDGKALAFAVEKPAKPLASSPSKETWQNKLTRFKADGEIEQALALCQSMFPLIGAYEQACILLRSQVKSAEADPTLRQTQLIALYRTAALAELLHDKSDAQQRLSHKQLQSIASDSYSQLDMPYQELGYSQLRLLRKADIKLLRATWGEPMRQQRPRQYHQAWWPQTAAFLSI